MAEGQSTTVAPAVEYRDLTPHGYPGYRVGDDGSVWSRWRRKGLGWGRGTTTVLGDRWKRMRLQPREDGHLQVNLRDSICYVHHLVLLAFVGPCPPGLECCHFDGDPANNRPGNLRWDTHQSNAADAVRHGVTTRGERNPGARLTAAQIVEIRAAKGVTNRVLASRFGATIGSVSNIRRRARWGHIAARETDSPLDTRNKPKLTPAQVVSIRAEYAAGGVSQTALGAKYGVSHTLISYIVHRKLWGDVA